MKILIVMFAAVIAVHFLVGFAILIVIYRLMIKTIRAMRETASRMSLISNQLSSQHLLYIQHL